jgi:carbon monoxide dehydrogenase subunit G
VKINGSFETSRGRPDVYDRLTDPSWLVQALDYPAPRESSADECTVHGDVGIGPWRGPIEIHLRIAGRQTNERATYRGWGQGLGSRLSLQASFHLQDTQSRGTRVEWSAEATIDGPVGTLANGLFHPLAESNFEHLKLALAHATT